MTTRIDFEKLTQDILSLCPDLKSLYLTGSYANGCENSFSDLDLYLFVNQYSERHKMLAKEVIEKLQLEYNIPVEADILDCSFLGPMPFGHPLFSARRNLLFASKKLYGEAIKTPPFSKKELRDQLLHITLTHLRLCSRARRRNGLDYSYLKRVFRFHICLACLENEELNEKGFDIIYQGLGRLSEKWRPYVPSKIASGFELLFKSAPLNVTFSRKFFLLHKSEIEEILEAHEACLMAKKGFIIDRVRELRESAQEVIVSDAVKETYKGNLKATFSKKEAGHLVNDTEAYQNFINEILAEYI